MTSDRATGNLGRLNSLKGVDLTKRRKVFVGVLCVSLFGFLAWTLIGYLHQFAITLGIIPIIGFIFIYGFWGYLLANFASFVVLLLTMYNQFGGITTELVTLTDLIFILVLIIIAGLISEQKDFIQRLYRQLIKQQSKEETLIDSRDDYRNLVYRIPIGLYRTTPDGKILEASSALIDLLGYPDFETLSFVNIGNELFVDPQDRDYEQSLLLEDGLVQDYELRLYKRNKDIIWVKDNVRAVQDDDGKIVCYEGSLEDITERKRMEAAEKEQRLLAEALRDTAAALSGTLEFEEVLDRILVNLEHVVPHDAANIMLVEKGSARLARSKGYISDWKEDVRKESRFYIEDIPTLNHMYKSGEPLAIPDTQESELWVNLPHSDWMKSYAGAPIKVKGKMIGFLNLNSSTKDFFTDTKAGWLQAFADQAGIAIENARMYGEIHEHARQTALINSITQTTIMAPDIEGMIQTLADRLGELLSSDGAFITLWDKEQNRAIPGAAFGPLKENYLKVYKAPNENSITSMVLSTGKLQILDEEELYAKDLLGNPEQCPIKSILGLPLIADGNKLGAVLISYDEPHQFLDEEIALSEQVARIIALAIYKTKLFESEKERTEDLARTNAVITSLGKAATRVEAINNFDRMVETLGEVLADLNLQSMVIMQDADGERYKLHHTSPGGKLSSSNTVEPKLSQLEPQFAAQDFYYYDEVIKQKRSIFFENFDLMIGKAFPVLEQLGKHEIEFEEDDNGRKKGFLLPLTPGKNVIGCLFIWGEEIYEFDLPAFSLFASQIAVAFENARLIERIQQIAITDELTGLYNRRGLFEIGRLEIERTRRYNLPLSAIVIDIDHFKRVNDRYSHAVGDQVLRSFAECVITNTRELDVIGRIGGEEFVLLLPGSNHQSARKTAARLQDLIAKNVTETGFGEIKITVSQGVAEMDSSMEDLNDLIQAADRALYRAKETGRNRVVSSSIGN
jgi:diguanylate cyclase (GGDEF)-like protein/PAS domain S-box-containing protein